MYFKGPTLTQVFSLICLIGSLGNGGTAYTFSITIYSHVKLDDLNNHHSSAWLQPEQMRSNQWGYLKTRAWVCGAFKKRCQRWYSKSVTHKDVLFRSKAFGFKKCLWLVSFQQVLTCFMVNPPCTFVAYSASQCKPENVRTLHQN